ncbi:MAG: TonB-dependent receptor [Ferruginibacter sp.]
MRKNLLLLLLNILLSVFAFAQKGSITGSIHDVNRMVLPGISIQLESTKFFSTSDNEGAFYFGNIPSGSYILIATGIGYTAKSSKVNIEGNKNVLLNLELNIVTASLKEVTVTGIKAAQSSNALTRTNTPLLDLPQIVQEVSRATIDEQQLFSVDQALKNVAGVNQDAYGAIVMRGFNTNALDFLTNGLKGPSAPEGVFPLLANVEQIEVIKGSTALLYGEGALGGNINLVTKQPKKFTTAHVSIGSGNLNLFRMMADVTGSLNKSKSLYFLAGAAYQKGGRFTNNFDNENMQFYGSVKWDITSKTSWQFNATYNGDRNTTNWQPDIPVYDDGSKPYSLSDDFTYAGKDSKYEGNSFQLQSMLAHKFNTVWKGNLSIGYSETRANRSQYSTYGIDPATNLATRYFTKQQINSPTLTINPYVNGVFNLAKIKNSIVAGLDINFERNNYPNGIQLYEAKPLNVLNPDYSSFDTTGAPLYLNSRTEKFTSNVMAAYLVDQITFSNKFKGLIGLRYTNYFRRYLAINAADGLPLYDERPERTESFTPKAGLVYQPKKNISIYIDYNRGFVPQYSNERKFGGPFDPETSNQFELGFKGDYFKNRLHATAAIYHITKKNVLIYYADSTFVEGYGFRPLQQVISKGIELGVTGNITDNLSLIVNYAYNDTRISESNDATDVGKTFNNAPYNTANGWVSYKFSKSYLKGLQIGFGLNYVDKRNTSFGTIPEYTVADALIGYTFKRYRLQINSNNLFDKRHVLNGGYGAYTPGLPRNFLATVSYSLK